MVIYNDNEGIFKDMIDQIIIKSEYNIVKFIFLHMRIFSTILSPILKKIKTVNALIRTTLAPTIISGGVQNNVIPSSVMARINLRIHPNDNIESIINHFKNTIDSEIKIIELKAESGESSKVSCNDCAPYKIISKILKNMVNDIITTPFLFVAGNFIIL
jgi:carboxypeptidase PM20D1